MQALLWFHTGLGETQFTVWSKGISRVVVLIVLLLQGCYWKVLLCAQILKDPT